MRFEVIMKCWLITNKYLSGPKYDVIVEHFLNASRELGLDLEHRYNDSIVISSDTTLSHRPDFVIYWDKDINLAKYLEGQGIPVLNSSEGISVCDDKRLTVLALDGKVSMPRTIIAPMTYENVGYTDYDYIQNVENVIGYPVVVKEAFGSYGRQVYLANDRQQLMDILKDISHKPHLFQQFVSSSSGVDMRLQVVGDKVVASMKRVSNGDFRANITNGGSMLHYTPTPEQSSLAIKVAKLLNLDFAGVDLLFGEDGPMVCEVNSNAHFDNLYQLTGVNTAKHILEYAMGKYSK